MVNTRQRYSAPHVRRRQISSSGDNAFVTKTIRQFSVSVIVFTLVVGISKVNIPGCKTFATGVKDTLSYTIDYKKSVAKIADAIKSLPIFTEKPSSEEEAQQADAEETDANGESIEAQDNTDADSN